VPESPAQQRAAERTCRLHNKNNNGAHSAGPNGKNFMNNENEMKTTGAGRGTQIAARIFAILLACIWVFFGIKDWNGVPEIVEEYHVHLGYPLYIIPFIGVTHILGALGLLIPKRTRVTDWVYAGLMYGLILAVFSHISTGDNFGAALDPIVVSVFVIASYVLRQRTDANLWSSK
jgi:uncharacterized membrane protein YphA (DoxX/SURF4 family)